MSSKGRAGQKVVPLEKKSRVFSADAEDEDRDAGTALPGYVGLRMAVWVWKCR